MRVLIVGAGPTGAALSLLLARRGIHVVLLDREVNFERVFRGEALMPSGVEAIAQMGLRDEFTRLPQRTVECMEFYVEGTRIIRAEWPEIKAANAVHIVSQPALIEMLTSAAGGYPTFEMRLGALVRDVKVTDDGVDLNVRYADSEETLHGDFVIGADGRASVIRARTDLKVERLPFPFDVAWFSLPLPPSQQEDPRFQAFSRGGRSVGLYPSWDGQLRLGLNVPAGASDARREMPGKDALLDEVGQVVGEPYATFIRKRKNDVADPVMLKILFGRCPQWTAKRTLLLGDAAHPMSPVRAQGINLALRDAIVAANHLAAALAKKEADKVQAAAERVQPERDPEIIESQRFQVAVAEPPLPARSAFLRATLLPVLRRIGVIKRLFLKAEIPLRHGVVPVRLEV
jgi:2-polyprenyl-6-methoxyphenol hydroxylase-like FAD-dependent oxidoreductase